MGDFARLAARMSQAARVGFANLAESDSSRILRTGLANKRGLSLLLDGTLKSGHNMRVFGLGTAASLSSRERYGRFTGSMHAVYSAMEDALDACEAAPVKTVWARFGDDLRRAPSLAVDLREVNIEPLAPGEPSASKATRAYVSKIQEALACDNQSGGARLLAHLYVRYFADLFGGQALAFPTRLALGLGPDSPRHYDFGSFGTRRRESIYSIYEALNEAGEMLGSEEARCSVADEANLAFALNVDVYSEEGRLYVDSARGLSNAALGYVRFKKDGAQVRQQPQ